MRVLLEITAAFWFGMTLLVQVQGDIATMMRESEAQQELLKDLQVRQALRV